MPNAAHAPADLRRSGADARPTRRGWSALSARDLVRVPGLLSLSRIPLAALFPLTLGRPGWGIGLLALAGATDLLDGWYARRFHQQTSTGALLDGVTDKVFVLTVVASLVVSGSMSVMETLLLGTRDIGELALAVRLGLDPRRRRRVKVPRANVGGKIATTLQYAAIVAVILDSSQRAVFIGAAALAGVLASASYWSRDVAAARA
ncbi:MAG: CDP-alcohol phosphatidyltransferase family protein [Labilithrix sp.]|nr:CDP-alcohol phosphatidyltransferase family protein [Labilithrix sp.]